MIKMFPQRFVNVASVNNCRTGSTTEKRFFESGKEINATDEG